MTREFAFQMPWTEERLENMGPNGTKRAESEPAIAFRKAPGGRQEKLEFKVEVTQINSDGTDRLAVVLHCLKGRNVTVFWNYKTENSEETSCLEKAVFSRPGHHMIGGCEEQSGGVMHRQVLRQILNLQHGYDNSPLEVFLRVEENEDEDEEDVFNDVARDFNNMLDSGDAADVHLVCGETEFPCHKTILAARSSVFKTMFFGQGEFQEGRKNCRVIIEDFQPEEIRQFLRFVYSGECDFNHVDPWQILTLADKYDVQMLNKTSCKVLQPGLNKENCLEYLDRACMFRAAGLIRSALEIALENPEIPISDDDWKRLGKKHPELTMELAKFYRWRN